MLRDEALLIKDSLTNALLYSAFGLSIRSVSEPNASSHTRTTPAKALSNGIGITLHKKDYRLKVYGDPSSTLLQEVLRRQYADRIKEIEVEDIGQISAKPILPVVLQDKHRPAFPGVSVGHHAITAGTFGCMVKNEKGAKMILSNNHVLANVNRGQIGDAVHQPGPLDNPNLRQTRIAKLYDFARIDPNGINTIDAALAKPNRSTDVKALVRQLGSFKGVANPRLGMRVYKLGRTTGYTEGIITARNVNIAVDFDGTNIQFEDQFEVRAKRGMFSDGGDSGSVIVEKESNKIVGLLFAGTDSGITFANVFRNVLAHFDVSLV